jgi:hypothetical protein
MILQSRASEMAIMQKQQDDILSLLNKEHKRISVILDQLEYPSQKLLISQLQSAQQQIEFILDNIYGKTGVWKGRKVAVGGELESLMVDAMQKASQAGIDGKIKASIALLNDVNPELIPYLPSLFSGIREDVIQKLMVRPLSDDRIFSQRFWKLKDLNNNLISQTLSSGMLEGKSAFEIAQDLEKFLVLKGKGPAERSALFPTPTERKIMSRTMTLARTEINNAFTESQIECAKREPWNDGIKWNLSASHKVYDVCDVYASQDLFQMGAGVYPPDNVPVRHPNCWCYLTDLLKSLDEVARLLKEDMKIPEREVIRVKGAVKPVIPKPVEVVPEKPTSQMTPKELREKILREHDTKEIEKAFDDYEKVSNEYGSLFKKYKATRDDKVYAELQATYDKLENARKTSEMLAKKDINEIHDILHYDKKGFNIEAIMVGKGSGAFTKHIQGQLDEISKFINPDIVKVKKVGITQKGGRAKEARGVMSLNAKSDIMTTAHEYGHVIEGMSNEVHRDTYGFFLVRTSGESDISLGRLLPHKYGSGEFCKKDKFLDPYMGKTYTGRTDTEILSMGMTMLFKNPLLLAKRDPEYFDVIMSVLRGL